MAAPSPPKNAAGSGATLRLHPRGQPPLHMGLASPPPAASAGYPYVPVPHRARVSPRQVKLQRMEPSPPYTLAVPLRDQVSSNFRHELFQFHQLLRDAVNNHRCEHQHADALRSSLLAHDRNLLELLSSDRGDAVLKEFFAQWQRYLKSKRPTEERQDDEGNSAVLWDVLETFFSSLPFSVSESDPGSPKKVLRYMDSLNSMRDLLTALLFKPLPAREKNGVDQDDEEANHGLESSIGLGFGLDFSGRGNTARSSPKAPAAARPKSRIPLYLYCQQLENELDALRRRVPHRKHHSAETVAGVVGDVGLLQDSTVMLLLDFWALPHKERLAFFCQIASQANEQDASAILHVFLDNCTTQTFLQVWEALQQSPQFQKMLREAALQFEPATGSDEAIPKTPEDKNSSLEIDTADLDRPGWRGSQRNMVKKRPRRSTRFVDFNGITEAFDRNKEGGDSDDEDGGDTFRDSPRSQKFTIRERGRLSLSDASDKPAGQEPTSRWNLLRQNSRRRQLKSPRELDSMTVLERIHDDLTEIIKMEDGPDAHVMDAVWQLLEALDGPHKGAGHRKSVAQPAAVLPVPSLPQQIIVQNPRISLRTPLSAEQQFIMKLDQLQSMLVALGDVRIHSMSTDTITGAYRRMPILAKLFSALTDASLGAAGIDTTGGGLLKIVSSYSKAQNIASSWQGAPPKEKTLDPLKAPPGTPKAHNGTADKVREDVETMGLLLNKFSTFVRSLTPLVDNEDAAPSGDSASDDVLMVLDLASKLESAGALAEVPPGSTTGGGKRRLSLAADRELPIILAVQSLARSNEFDDVSRLILASVVAKMSRVRAAALEGKSNEDDNEDGVAMEGDEEVLRIVKNLRRASAKAAQIQEAHDQLQLQLQSGGMTPSEGDAATLRLANRDIPSNIKNSQVLRGLKLFRVDILLRIVNQLYRDSYEGMVSTLQYGSRRMEFSEFIYDWHIRKYGLKALAQRHLLKLIQSLRKYDKKVFQCQLCLRFMGIQSPLGFHEHKFVLGLLSRWSAGTFSGGSKHRLALPKRQFKIRISFGVSTVQEALRERFGVFGRGIDALAERIRAKAINRDEEFVRESDLLTICVEEFASQRALLEKVLGAVYLAGDINGDGSLEFDEFASVVTHLSPTVDDRFLQKVFEAAHDYSKPHRISFARFLDVVLLERVLSPVAPSAAATGAMRAKNAAATNGSSGTALPVNGGGIQQTNATLKVVLQDEQEETYQFELLRETWSHDREAVTHVLQTSITHAPTAKTLTFRVAFLDQLLERRVDSKTAWLCHRQIMREIARYQHLDAEQVAGLRRKEQQFKKTVRAIRNAQRLSTLFSSPPIDRENSGGVSDASEAETVAASAPEPPPRPCYTATVRLSIEGGMDIMPNVADVAALENELRETFLERADEGAIEDYMAAMQHLRRMTIKQQSLQESREDIALLKPEETVLEEDEVSDDSDDDNPEKPQDEDEDKGEENSDDDDET